MKKEYKGKKNKKLRKGFCRFLLILFLFCVFVVALYFGMGKNIKNIYIYNNENLSDQEIIELANLENYPNFYTTFSSTIENNIKQSNLIKTVKVKKRLFGQVHIYITEYKVLFYNQETGKYILENKKEIISNKKISVPILINYIPNTKYDVFIKKYSKIDFKITQKISEIKYDPNDIDTDRFLLYMNDGNYVYVTLTKFDLLNKYNEAVTKLEGKTGTLYLDSGNYFEIRK